MTDAPKRPAQPAPPPASDPIPPPQAPGTNAPPQAPGTNAPTSEPPLPATPQPAPPQPDNRAFLGAFGRIGLMSFGGPAAQMAVMHRELVERQRWLSEDQYLRALSFCMLLPGPEAMQLATYAGWRLRGVPGGLIAGLLFVVPGALVMLALAMGYGIWGGAPLVQAAFLGIKAAVVVVVFEALLRLARKALRSPDRWALAALAFVGIFTLALPFPLIIAAAALFGALRAPTAAAPPAQIPPQPPAATPISPARTARTVTLWAALWGAPLGALALMGAERLTAIGLFFSKLAVVTFGGAYAVLAYMTQEVVQTHGWITTAQMMDGLGLAETTPGPLILVTEFVGFLAGANGAPNAPLTMGIAAAALTLWVTFVPCFLWIFAGAPYIELLASRPRLSGALSGISAAVVGVIANLSLWFALHVFFAEVTVRSLGPATLPIPRLGSLDPAALALALLCAALLLWARKPLPLVLALVALAGAGMHFMA